VKLVLSQVSPDMREPIAPTLFDAAAAHISATEFLYPDQSWKELCGMIDALSAGSAGGKGQLQGYVEAMMRFARKHDEVEFRGMAKKHEVERCQQGETCAPGCGFLVSACRFEHPWLSGEAQQFLFGERKMCVSCIIR